MKPEHYKPIRKEKPKQKGKISARKSRMLKVAQEWKPITSPQLREAYSTKIEWARKLIPKLKKEAEAPEEKEQKQRELEAARESD
jgi:predicted HTH transcriptional regulator